MSSVHYVAVIPYCRPPKANPWKPLLQDLQSLKTEIGRMHQLVSCTDNHQSPKPEAYRHKLEEWDVAWDQWFERYNDLLAEESFRRKRPVDELLEESEDNEPSKSHEDIKLSVKMLATSCDFERQSCREPRKMGARRVFSSKVTKVMSSIPKPRRRTV